MTAKTAKWKQSIKDSDLEEIVPARLQQLIDVMQRVKNLNRRFTMWQWQHIKWFGSPADDIKETEDALVECGTPACLGGWLAVSPEFQKVGGYVGYEGCPEMQYDVHCSDGDKFKEKASEGNAVYMFLAAKHEIYTSEDYCVSDTLCNELVSPMGVLYCNDIQGEIKADDVLERLHYIQTRLLRLKNQH